MNPVQRYLAESRRGDQAKGDGDARKNQREKFYQEQQAKAKAAADEEREKVWRDQLKEKELLNSVFFSFQCKVVKGQGNNKSK